MRNKTIFVIPEATQEELEKFADMLDNEKETIMVGADCKMFKVVEGEMFEVVTS